MESKNAPTSRGDRALAPAVERAYQLGALFCSWVDMLEIAPREGGPTWYLPFTREAAPDLRISEGWLRIVRPTEVDERDEA